MSYTWKIGDKVKPMGMPDTDYYTISKDLGDTWLMIGPGGRYADAVPKDVEYHGWVKAPRRSTRLSMRSDFKWVDPEAGKAALRKKRKRKKSKRNKNKHKKRSRVVKKTKRRRR